MSKDLMLRYLSRLFYEDYTWQLMHSYYQTFVESICKRITLNKIGQPECDKTERVQIEKIWYIFDNLDQCISDLSSTRLTFHENLPSTCDRSSMCIRLYRSIHKYLIIRFRSKDCLSTRNLNTVNTTCLITSVIGIVNSDFSCQVELPSERYILYGNTFCENPSKCSVPSISFYDQIAYMHFHCKDNSSKLVGDISTEAQGSTNLPDDNISKEHQRGPNYAAIAGGIVGGIVLSICIILGVFLLRRRNCTGSSKEQVIASLNPSNDPTHVQAQAEPNQQGHLMNSADTLYVSTSHAINVDNTKNEESNTYLHIRNAVDDFEVMYDHTIRHNIHATCDGDYGIAHRRITEDDYDVSGNYLQSISKEADPVYNLISICDQYFSDQMTYVVYNWTILI